MEGKSFTFSDVYAFPIRWLSSCQFSTIFNISTRSRCNLRALLKSCSKANNLQLRSTKIRGINEYLFDAGDIFFAFHLDDIMASYGKSCGSKSNEFLVPSFPSNSSYTDNFLIEVDEKTSRFPDECIRYRTRNVFSCNFPFSNSCFPNGNVLKSEMVNTAVRTTDENFLSKPPPRSSVLIPSKILIHFIRFYDCYRAACEMSKKKVNSCSE